MLSAEIIKFISRCSSFPSTHSHALHERSLQVRKSKIVCVFVRGSWSRAQRLIGIIKRFCRSVDARDRDFGIAERWSDDTVFSSRAYFMPDKKPAELGVDHIREEDAGIYRCRVDFQIGQTRNSKVNLTVIGKNETIFSFALIVRIFFQGRSSESDFDRLHSFSIERIFYDILSTIFLRYTTSFYSKFVFFPTSPFLRIYAHRARYYYSFFDFLPWNLLGTRRYSASYQTDIIRLVWDFSLRYILGERNRNVWHFSALERSRESFERRCKGVFKRIFHGIVALDVYLLTTLQYVTR